MWFLLPCFQPCHFYLTASFVWFRKLIMDFLKVRWSSFNHFFNTFEYRSFLSQCQYLFYPLKFISIFHVMLLLVYDFNRLEKLVAKGMNLGPRQ